MPCSQIPPSWLLVAEWISALSPTYSPLNYTGISRLHFPEMWGFSINSLCCFLRKCVSCRDVTCKYGDGKRCNWTNHAYELLKKKYLCTIIYPIYIDTLLHNIAGLLMLTAASRQKIRGPAADVELCGDTESASEELYCIPSPTFLPWCFVCSTVITFQRNYEHTTLQLRTICHVQPFNTPWGT